MLLQFQALRFIVKKASWGGGRALNIKPFHNIGEENLTYAPAWRTER